MGGGGVRGLSSADLTADSLALGMMGKEEEEEEDTDGPALTIGSSEDGSRMSVGMGSGCGSGIGDRGEGGGGLPSPGGGRLRRGGQHRRHYGGEIGLPLSAMERWGMGTTTPTSAAKFFPPRDAQGIRTVRLHGVDRQERRARQGIAVRGVRQGGQDVQDSGRVGRYLLLQYYRGIGPGHPGPLGLGDQGRGRGGGTGSFSLGFSASESDAGSASESGEEFRVLSRGGGGGGSGGGEGEGTFPNGNGRAFGGIDRFPGADALTPVSLWTRDYAHYSSN